MHETRSIWKLAGILPLIFTAAFSVTCFAGDKDAKKDPPKPATPPRYMQMDYGPFLSASMMSDPKAKFRNADGHFEGSDVTPKGIAVRLGADWIDGIVFDTDTLRYSAGWMGGQFKLKGVPFDGGHGPGPTLGVPPMFGTLNGPGWADRYGNFTDPRKDVVKPLPPPGPLPAEWGKYKGLYRNGQQIVFSYLLGKSSVLDMAAIEGDGANKAFARNLTIGATENDLKLIVLDTRPVLDAKLPPDTKPTVISVDGGVATAGDVKVSLVNAPAGSKFVSANGQIQLHLPQLKDTANFKIIITKGDAAAAAKASKAPLDLNTLTKGGPAMWTETIETKGVVGTGSEAYVVDTLTLPYENPYKAWMRIGGFDFFSNQTSAALSTWSGDVWIVTGIDDTLEHLKWKRFATGLHQPLGLRIVDDKIYVVGKDQITRLHDLNNDGEADFYECFNSDWQLTTAFHSFCYDLQTDKEGNFYFIFGAPVHAGGGGFQNLTDHHGCLMKVSKDGSKMSVYATGFRSPNGIGISPDGQLTSGDNQGTWVPASPLHWIKPGSFNGVTDTAHGVEVHQPKALCFMPQNVDNSCGGQVWVTSDKWGPFNGEMLHMSYGQSALFKVLKEEVNGQMQGGVVKFPVKLASSAMRARFNTKDGQLYISGLKGWQTNGNKDGGFDRVRYTGAAVRMPTELHATTKGVTIGFTCELDAAAAADLQNYNCEVWNYKWTSAYGSPQVSTLTEAPVEPKTDKPGDTKKKKAGDHHDPMTIKSATLSADKKSVFLEIADMRPVMQMKLTFNIKAADGTTLKSEIHNTIHNLGEAK
ncbi:MAG: DUF6797 domain-containing protein [Planctomycetota bacterium]